jgi:hypothetical protein
VSTIKDKIKGARLAERTVPVCLDGALVAEIEAADRELKRLTEQPGADSLEGNGLRAAAERVEELRRQMQDATEEFRLRALPRKRWKALIALHGPRRDEDNRVDERDRAIGVNVDTFFPALVRASVIAPELDAEDWTALLGDEQTDGVLTDRQFDELANAAWYLNRDTVDVPFSHAASRILNSEPE